jgi:hypothetical protein
MAALSKNLNTSVSLKYLKQTVSSGIIILEIMVSTQKMGAEEPIHILAQKMGQKKLFHPSPEDGGRRTHSHPNPDGGTRTYSHPSPEYGAEEPIHIPEDCNLIIHQCEKLKCHLFFFVFP